LLPLTFTRPCADLRIGILTIREKWETLWQCKSSTLTEAYLQAKFPLEKSADNLLVNGTLLPNKELVKAIERLETGQALMNGETLLALRCETRGVDEFTGNSSAYSPVAYNGPWLKINAPWDIFSKNVEALEADFEMLTAGRKSAPLSSTNTLLGAERIFAEEG